MRRYKEEKTRYGAHGSGGRKLLMPALVFVLCFGACGEEEEGPGQVILESGDDAAEYTLVECIRGDVEEIQTIACQYRKNDEQEVYLPVSGKRIEKVYVQEGDAVKAGDVLVELATGNMASQISELEYRIRRNELLLSYVDEEEDLELRGMYYAFAAMGDRATEDDKADYDKSVENTKTRNEQKRNGYRDSLEFDRKKLAQLRAEYAASRVTAKFDGRVNHVEKGLLGTTSNVETCIMTIVDEAEGYFEAQATDLANYINEDTSLKMQVFTGKGRGEYELVPKDYKSWGDKIYFSILKGENTDSLEAGTRGEISVVTNRKDDVVLLSSDCIRHAGDKYYVYMLNDEGLREVNWIETGIVGDGVTEIVSGLKEGDEVILR